MFSRILKPLEPFSDRTMVLTGLAHKNGNALGDGPGDHARAAARVPHRRAPARPPAPTSRTASRSIRSLPRTSAPRHGFRSIELGCDDSRTVGNCDSGYSCAYTNSVSWRSPTSPMPPETNPRLAFERLFGGLDAGLDAETRARRRRRAAASSISSAERTLAGLDARAARPPQDGRVPDVGARDRAAHPAGRAGHARGRRRISRCRAACR